MTTSKNLKKNLYKAKWKDKNKSNKLPLNVYSVSFKEMFGEGFEELMQSTAKHNFNLTAKNAKKTFTTLSMAFLWLYENPWSSAVVLRKEIKQHRTTTWPGILRAAIHLAKWFPIFIDDFKFNNTTMVVTRKSTGQQIFFLGLEKGVGKLGGFANAKGHTGFVLYDEPMDADARFGKKVNNAKERSDYFIVVNSIMRGSPKKKAIGNANPHVRDYWWITELFEVYLKEDIDILEGKKLNKQGKKYYQSVLVKNWEWDEKTKYGNDLFLFRASAWINEYLTNDERAEINRRKISSPTDHLIWDLGVPVSTGNTIFADYVYFVKKLEQAPTNKNIDFTFTGMDFGLKDQTRFTIMNKYKKLIFNDIFKNKAEFQHRVQFLKHGKIINDKKHLSGHDKVEWESRVAREIIIAHIQLSEKYTKMKNQHIIFIDYQNYGIIGAFEREKTILEQEMLIDLKWLQFDLQDKKWGDSDIVNRILKMRATMRFWEISPDKSLDDIWEWMNKDYQLDNGDFVSNHWLKDTRDSVWYGLAAVIDDLIDQ